MIVAATEEVTLTWLEVYMGALAGISRRIESQQEGRRNSHGYSNREAWDVDVEGALGEMALAKHLGRFWGGDLNTFKAPDLQASGLQVRTTHHPNGHLIVRDHDPDDHRYILVRGHAPHYEIVGWMEGRLAKRKAWLKAPDGDGRPPAYFVPPARLRRLQTLPEVNA